MLPGLFLPQISAAFSVLPSSSSVDFGAAVAAPTAAVSAGGICLPCVVSYALRSGK